MKRYLLIFLLIIGCEKKYNTPKELREKVWMEIRFKDNEFYSLCEINEYNKTKFDGDLMIFYLMADEYETVKQVKPTKNGYEINFLDSKHGYGSIDYKFNFEWIDKQKGISYWKYSDKNKNPDDEAAYSFYAIDSLMYDKLPHPPCIECFSRKQCQEMIKNGEW